jgi:hypothetical protein
MSGSSTEAVWNGVMRTVPAGREVSASCVTAAKLYACALLHSILRNCVRPDVSRVPRMRWLRDVENDLRKMKRKDGKKR